MFTPRPQGRAWRSPLLTEANLHTAPMRSTSRTEMERRLKAGSVVQNSSLRCRFLLLLRLLNHNFVGSHLTDTSFSSVMSQMPTLDLKEICSASVRCTMRQELNLIGYTSYLFGFRADAT